MSTEGKMQLSCPADIVKVLKAAVVLPLTAQNIHTELLTEFKRLVIAVHFFSDSVMTVNEQITTTTRLFFYFSGSQTQTCFCVWLVGLKPHCCALTMDGCVI